MFFLLNCFGIMVKILIMRNYYIKQAAEGARIAGASRIIGVDLNPARFEEGIIHK